MCLIGVRIDDHLHYRLMVAANRDERHDRPTEAADFWSDHPDILAGRDLKAGGTWLGVHRSGRFAAITNIHGRPAPSNEASSRGEWVRDFLLSEQSAHQWCQRQMDQAAQMAGFHLLVHDGSTMMRLSQDRPLSAAKISPGCHAWSNHTSSEGTWQKCRGLAAELKSIGDSQSRALAGLLHALDKDRESGITKLELGELRQRTFIHNPQYGTRCSTALLIGHDGEVEFLERRYDAQAKPSGESHRSFTIR